RLYHQQSIATIRIVLRQSLGHRVSKTQIQLLSGNVVRSNLKPDNARASTTETIFNPFQETARQAPASMFWSDADSRDMAGVVRLEQPDYESSHRAILHYHAIRNRFSRRQQILERVAA